MELNLNSVNDRLADSARSKIIEIERDRVVGADPSENIAGRTVREVVTNHQITTSDRLGLYREKGWHGLGETIEDGLSGEDAVRRYLPWSVERVQAEVTIGGMTRPIPVWANVRSDNEEILGLVGPDFTAVQNIEIGKFGDAIVGADAAVTMETCGSLLGGRKVFLLLRVPREVRVGKSGDDLTIPYLLIANGHDGSMAMTVLWTMERVVCNNTYTRALGRATNAVDEGTAFRIRHVGDVAGQLEQARRVLGIAASGLTEYETRARALAEKFPAVSAIEEYFRAVYVSTFGAAPTDGPKELVEAWEMRRDRVVGEMTAILDSDSCRIDGIGGSMWAALNAVTEWMDKKRSPGIKGDRRDHLKVLGAGAVSKRRAMAMALATL